MRTTLLALLAATLLVGCGASEESEPPASQPPPAPTTTGPADPPPKIDQDGPPPAWVETARGPFWLGYSSYCWDSVCADHVTAECGAKRFTPSVRVASGERVTFQLGFEPTSVSLHFPAPAGTPRPAVSEHLATANDPSWKVNRLGVAVLSARAAGGKDASYTACLVPQTLSVAEALAQGDGEVVVEGPLWVSGDDVRLCDAVAESYPPQCPSGYLKVRALDLADVEGLNEASGVRWTDSTVVLTGTLQGDVLHVRG